MKTQLTPITPVEIINDKPNCQVAIKHNMEILAESPKIVAKYKQGHNYYAWTEEMYDFYKYSKLLITPWTTSQIAKKFGISKGTLMKYEVQDERLRDLRKFSEDIITIDALKSVHKLIKGEPTKAHAQTVDKWLTSHYPDYVTKSEVTVNKAPEQIMKELDSDFGIAQPTNVESNVKNDISG
jgi:methyl coenzyme M reductase gamma subunit